MATMTQRKIAMTIELIKLNHWKHDDQALSVNTQTPKVIRASTYMDPRVKDVKVVVPSRRPGRRRFLDVNKAVSHSIGITNEAYALAFTYCPVNIIGVVQLGFAVLVQLKGSLSVAVRLTRAGSVRVDAFVHNDMRYEETPPRIRKQKIFGTNLAGQTTTPTTRKCS